MSLTLPDQADRLRCIEDLDTNLVVEAAAGTGKTSLMACRVAMLLAAVCAEGTSTINNADQIERGYERIDERLNALGAKITRVPARPRG